MFRRTTVLQQKVLLWTFVRILYQTCVSRLHTKIYSPTQVFLHMLHYHTMLAFLVPSSATIGNSTCEHCLLKARTIWQQIIQSCSPIKVFLKNTSALDLETNHSSILSCRVLSGSSESLTTLSFLVPAWQHLKLHIW